MLSIKADAFSIGVLYKSFESNVWKFISKFFSFFFLYAAYSCRCFLVVPSFPKLTILGWRFLLVELCLLMGLGGFSRPAPRATWHGLGFPFADRVVLHGHHQSNIKSTNILRFKRVQPAGLASAALDGCSKREAVS